MNRFRKLSRLNELERAKGVGLIMFGLIVGNFALINLLYVLTKIGW